MQYKCYENHGRIHYLGNNNKKNMCIFGVVTIIFSNISFLQLVESQIRIPEYRQPTVYSC